LKENDLTKLARWIIPGWMAIISLVGFCFFDWIVTKPQNSKTFQQIISYVQSPSEISAIVLSIIVAASGVPLGFIIYQAYFYLRWNSPFSSNGLIPPLLTGRLNDLNKSLDDISVSDLTFNKEWRTKWVENPLFHINHGYKWRYIELLFSEAAQSLDDKNSSVSIYSRHRYLHEITHTLGASIGAIYFGFIGYFLLKCYEDKLSFSLNSFLVLLLTVFLFYLLNKEENKNLIEYYNLSDKKLTASHSLSFLPKAAISKEINLLKNKTVNLQILYPGFLYLTFFLFFHLLNNPFFYNSSFGRDFIFYILICLFIIIVFAIKFKIKHQSKYTLNCDISIMLISLIISIIYKFCPLSRAIRIEWPLFSNICLFLVANVILFNNRQNVINDMLALENYVLKQYLYERQTVFSKKGNKND
jgi:hypothetical protein